MLKVSNWDTRKRPIDVALVIFKNVFRILRKSYSGDFNDIYEQIQHINGTLTFSRYLPAEIQQT